MDDRSYVVKVVDSEYRRSRRHVIVVQEDPLAESPDLVEAAPTVLGDYEVTSDPNLTLTHWSHRDCCAGFNALRTLVAQSVSAKAHVWHKDYSME